MGTNPEARFNLETLQSVVKIPLAAACAELEVHKSRFLAELVPILDPEESKSTVKAFRKLHPRARHVVHAFTLNAIGKTLEGASDDGEPSGTGGRPILDILHGEKITNCLIVVIRYFGGVLLGTGGLSRAYAEAAKRVVETARFQELIPCQFYEVIMDYPLQNSVMRMAENLEVEIFGRIFGEAVRFQARVPDKSEEIWKKSLEEYRSRGFSVDFFKPLV